MRGHESNWHNAIVVVYFEGRNFFNFCNNMDTVAPDHRTSIRCQFWRVWGDPFSRGKSVLTLLVCTPWNQVQRHKECTFSWVSSMYPPFIKSNSTSYSHIWTPSIFREEGLLLHYPKSTKVQNICNIRKIWYIYCHFIHAKFNSVHTRLLDQYYMDRCIFWRSKYYHIRLNSYEI